MTPQEFTQHPFTRTLLQIANNWEDEVIEKFAYRALDWVREHKDEAGQLVIELIEDQSLRNESSLGGGAIPAIATEFIAELSDPVIIPRLLAVLPKLDESEELFDAIWDALSGMGDAVLKPTLDFIANKGDNIKLGELGAALLGDSGVQGEEVYQTLLAELQHAPMLLAIYLGDYGDKRALPHLIGAFDDIDIDDQQDFPAAEVLNELGSAIEDLGGTLTESQADKYQHARSIHHGKIPDTAFHRLARLATPPAAEVTYTRFIWISLDPDETRALSDSNK